MSGYEIATLVLGIGAVLSGVAWGVIVQRGKSLVENGKELRVKYLEAMLDGNITDQEKLEIGQEVIEVIDDALTLWQSGVNIFTQIKRVVLRR